MSRESYINRLVSLSSVPQRPSVVSISVHLLKAPLKILLIDKKYVFIYIYYLLLCIFNLQNRVKNNSSCVQSNIISHFNKLSEAKDGLVSVLPKHDGFFQSLLISFSVFFILLTQDTSRCCMLLPSLFKWHGSVCVAPAKLWLFFLMDMDAFLISIPSPRSPSTMSSSEQTSS